eukprot:CAMPEP_0182518318 /NCGR_PEP_ID=MMETSP1321-20130603/44046_1 /TAXON_ID=91990 /ORGANISM="Bolidomonas sp., Strain RCC1657" /LENGTH=138 /DNA_ID=CAMNT_0024726191 /DNA_START=84 /DNA_END=497 /DNA_ORIENTATION=+
MVDENVVRFRSEVSVRSLPTYQKRDDSGVFFMRDGEAFTTYTSCLRYFDGWRFMIESYFRAAVRRGVRGGVDDLDDDLDDFLEGESFDDFEPKPPPEKACTAEVVVDKYVATIMSRRRGRRGLRGLRGADMRSNNCGQ